MGENYLVTAKGKYNHHLELDMEYIGDDPSLSFTWKCTKPKDGEIIALVNNGISGVNSINDLKDKVLQPEIIGEDIFINHEEALKEIIVIMEQVYKFEE
jgi:hypothetical protein